MTILRRISFVRDQFNSNTNVFFGQHTKSARKIQRSAGFLRPPTGKMSVLYGSMAFYLLTLGKVMLTR